eukprot:CAMPEP_0181357296 /NCGR_PEP_ID=MMETSP1106-20121128/4878_1 /TAXON_ID=81844 /ORGANISM="Mantoniella antarctica, Strain SL-175" /LENGTH=127 /DNA_ID=CAMNT_0023470135 /DNA_START=147 /DNA_END=530 /DNA_ORIENTATION=-
MAATVSTRNSECGNMGRTQAGHCNLCPDSRAPRDTSHIRSSGERGFRWFLLASSLPMASRHARTCIPSWAPKLTCGRRGDDEMERCFRRLRAVAVPFFSSPSSGGGRLPHLFAIRFPRFLVFRSIQA